MEWTPSDVVTLLKEILTPLYPIIGTIIVTYLTRKITTGAEVEDGELQEKEDYKTLLAYLEKQKDMIEDLRMEVYMSAREHPDYVDDAEAVLDSLTAHWKDPQSKDSHTDPKTDSENEPTNLSHGTQVDSGRVEGGVRDPLIDY
jgi:hypothetical protein